MTQTDIPNLYLRYPLDASRQDIRVLYVQPGKWSDPLRCSLVVLPLEESKHVCLSYTWMGQSPSLAISIDGSNFKVMPSVYAALRRLRQEHSSFSSDEPYKIWIDSICINQEDDAEKGQQVGLMRDIYSRAERVNIWLGEIPSTWQDPTIDYMAFVAQDEECAEFSVAEAMCNWLYDDSVQPCPEEDIHLHLDTTELQERDDVLFHDPHSDARESFLELSHLVTAVVVEEVNVATEVLGINPKILSRQTAQKDVSIRAPEGWRRGILMASWIMGRPWWTRLWTIQEVVLPQKSSVLYFGAFRLHFDTFLKFMDVFSDEYVKIYHRLKEELGSWIVDRLMVKAVASQALFALRSRAEGPPGSCTPLETVNLVTRSYSATNPKDYLYGVLGLIDPSQSHLVQIDYSAQRMAGQVFLNATRALVRHYKDLRHLYLASGPNAKRGYLRAVKEDEKVPSWAINWSNTHEPYVQSEACGRTLSPSWINGILQSSQPQDWSQTFTIHVAYLGQHVQATSTSVWPGVRKNYPNTIGLVRKYVEDALAISGQFAELDFPDDYRFQRALLPEGMSYIDQKLSEVAKYPHLVASWCCWIVSYDDDDPSSIYVENYGIFTEITRMAWYNFVGFNGDTKACFFVTSAGKLGHAKFRVEDGDELFAIPNMHHAAVLRPVDCDSPEQPETTKQYIFIGFCYLEDFDVHALVRPWAGSDPCDQEQTFFGSNAAHKYIDLEPVELV